jgi:hypothetical protein
MYYQNNPGENYSSNSVTDHYCSDSSAKYNWMVDFSNLDDYSVGRA